jgi:hypothetical protein
MDWLEVWAFLKSLDHIIGIIIIVSMVLFFVGVYVYITVAEWIDSIKKKWKGRK